MGICDTLSKNKNKIFYFCSFIPFTLIDFIQDNISIWSTLCACLRLAIIFALLLKSFKIRNRLSTPDFFVLLYLVLGFFSACIYSIRIKLDVAVWFKNVYYGVYYATYLVGITLILEEGIRSDIDSLVGGALLWFEVLIYANLIFYLIHPLGYANIGKTNASYFLGNYNTTIRKVFPGLVFGALYAFKSKRRLTVRYACMYLALFYFLFNVRAAVALVGLVIFGLGIIFFSLRGTSGVFRFEYFILLSVVITIVFVAFGQLEVLSGFITEVLGKGESLASRSRIWARAIELIQEQPVFGYGFVSIQYTKGIMRDAVDPHNIYLGILYYGGIIGMVLLAVILYVVNRRIRSFRGKNSVAAAVFDVAFCAYFFIWNFEPTAGITEIYKIFAIMVMAYYCGEFANYIGTYTPPAIGRRKKS